MQVKYYKVGQLAYATRQRYIDISRLSPYKEEENKSVRLGNGANTSVKTQVNDLDEPRHITYVTIDDTRWFVTDYVYLNGKQVQFNLQRDVVGEFGLGTSYGRIERGYTDGILKYRKELSLNEVLVKRVPLKSNSNTYGNLTVDNHDGEMWGILYFTKDTSKDKISINIPAFNPVYETSAPPQLNVRYQNGEIIQDIFLSANTVVKTGYGNKACRFTYRAVYTDASTVNTSIDWAWASVDIHKMFLTISGTPTHWEDGYFDRMLELIKNYLDQNLQANGFSRPSTSGVFGLEPLSQNADGNIYKEGSDFYEYKAVSIVRDNAGSYDWGLFVSGLNAYLKSQTSGQWGCTSNDTGYHKASSSIRVDTISYTRTLVPHSKAGIIDVPMTQQLVDEPYCILAFPLYSTSLSIGGKTYPVSKTNAFNIFNEVILALSGKNGFLVDAQIYPYCPDIDKVQTTLASEDGNSYPFMSVLSTSFETDVAVQPRPYLDVKKDYITRSYSIVSPDQSSKFTFSIYDYVREFVPDTAETDKNAVSVNIKIKTALKPFSIISSAVITRVDSLKGLNYASNLEGSQSASGGFECSLASDAFETYKRQNSNYQQLFDVDRTELLKNQEVERVNERTQFVMNMLTGTAFGAITGAQIGDLGVANLAGAKAIGAGIGATASAAAIGITGGIQLAKNEDLREYEREIQQQRFDLTIGTIKNLPNSVNRISSFNEIIMKDFYYVLETYECTRDEMQVVENFIENYGYGIGVFDIIKNYQKNGWFLKASVTKSELPITLHQAFKNDLEGGVYIYEQI